LGREDEDVLQFLTVPRTELWVLDENETETKLPITVSAKNENEIWLVSTAMMLMIMMTTMMTTIIIEPTPAYDFNEYELTTTSIL